MGQQQSELAPLARESIQDAVRRDVHALQQRHPSVQMLKADLVDFNYVSSKECTATTRMVYTRPLAGPASPTESSSAAPAAVAAASSSSSAASSSRATAAEPEEIHELWHYRARPSPKGSAPGPDGEHLWLAERMAQDAADAALASMRGEGKSNQPRRKKNAVADVPASVPSF